MQKAEMAEFIRRARREGVPFDEIDRSLLAEMSGLTASELAEAYRERGVTKPKPSNWKISRGAPELSEALRGVVIHSARQTDPQEAPLSSRAVRGLSEPCHASRSAFPCTRHGKAQPPSVPSAESVHIAVTASSHGRTTSRQTVCAEAR